MNGSAMDNDKIDEESGSEGGKFVKVACCVCGASITPNPTGQCGSCLSTSVDITEGIPTKFTVYQCRGCMRYLRPPWVKCEMESKELMAICLKKIVALKDKKEGGLRLINASWIWTEPHSKRLKIRLSVQRQVMHGAILQQSFVVEYVIRNQQCPNCSAIYTNQMWKAVVQVRQRVDHKRTFFYVEQLILKHSAHSKCINIRTHKDGMDFYFFEKGHANRFVDFLLGVIPAKAKHTKKLISADNHSNTGNFHFTHLVTILPICKDDLVVLPQRLAESEGYISRLCLANRITSTISLIDPVSAQRAEICVEKYSKHPFHSLLSGNHLVRFVVLGSEFIHEPRRVILAAPVSKRSNSAIDKSQSFYKTRYQLAEVEVAREADLGANDERYTAITHLGRILRTGDTVLGYHLTNQANINAEELGLRTLPDVILVRKVYEKHGKRKWTLKSLEKEECDEPMAGRGGNSQQQQQMEDGDREFFFQQLEGDKEMREKVDLYRLHDNPAEDEQRYCLSIDNSISKRRDEPDDEPDEEELIVDELLSVDKMNIQPNHNDNSIEELPSDHCNNCTNNNGGKDEGRRGDEVVGDAKIAAATEKGLITTTTTTDDLYDYEDL